MLAIRHLFFDLDHTLWDFDRNAADTLRALHTAHDLGRWFTADEFVVTYTRINHAAWEQFHCGAISQTVLRTSRFPDTFRALGAPPEAVPVGLGEAFIYECSGRSGTFPHAHTVLAELRARGYPLHIVTNGFRDSQHRKLSASGLAPYFTEIITTDCAGCAKPDPRIFALALARAGAHAAESVMIGDSLTADVRGAEAAGLTGVFFNPTGMVTAEPIRYEIRDLRELLLLL